MKPNVFLALVFLSLPLAAACRLPLASRTLMNGVTAARADSWDEAVILWKNALAQNPGSAAAHNNLAIAYEKKGAWEEARKEYEAALGLVPDNPTIKDNFERFKSRREAARTDKGPAARGGNVAASALERSR
jgi:Tfp pilus assembly protein PilF